MDELKTTRLAELRGMVTRTAEEDAELATLEAEMLATVPAEAPAMESTATGEDTTPTDAPAETA